MPKVLLIVCNSVLSMVKVCASKGAIEHVLKKLDLSSSERGAGQGRGKFEFAPQNMHTKKRTSTNWCVKHQVLQYLQRVLEAPARQHSHKNQVHIW